MPCSGAGLHAGVGKRARPASHTQSSDYPVVCDTAAAGLKAHPWLLPGGMRAPAAARGGGLPPTPAQRRCHQTTTPNSAYQVWTEVHRTRYGVGRREVLRRHADNQLAQWLKRADVPRSGQAMPYAAAIRAVFCYLRVGGAWRTLHFGVLLWRIAYGWFRHWLGLGLFDALVRHVALLGRWDCKCKVRQHLAVTDMRLLKCIPARGSRGFDTTKKASRRKRDVFVDAGGTGLSTAVVPASAQERDTRPALDKGKHVWPCLRDAVLGRASEAVRCRGSSTLHGVHHQVFERAPGQFGFVVLERC